MTQTNPGSITPDALTPGTRVRITKQVARTGKAPSTTVEGVVASYQQRKTGSWFAHAKDDKLWLDRLEIQKDDGEIYICNVDAHTRIEIIPPQPPESSPEGGAGVSPADSTQPTTESAES